MTEDFGLSPTDQEVLNRLKANRDKHIAEKAEEKAEPEDITPIIRYAEPISTEEKKMKKKMASIEQQKRIKREKQEAEASQSKENQPSPEISTDTRCSPRAEIITGNDCTILRWKRKVSITDRHSMLHLPLELHSMFSGYVVLDYNTKTQQIVISKAQDTPEATG